MKGPRLCRSCASRYREWVKSLERGSLLLSELREGVRDIPCVAFKKRRRKKHGKKSK